MKIKNLLLTTLAAMTLLACKGGNTSTDNADAQPAASQATAQLDLGFLKKLGIDVSKLYTIGDTYNFKEFENLVALENAQVVKLLPMVQSTSDEAEVEEGYYIEAVKALPGGCTMLIFAVEYGDSGTNLMAIYDKNGNLVDFMDLGNCNEMTPLEYFDDDFKRGKSQATNTVIQFKSPGEFTLDKTVKEGEWQREDESKPVKFTKVMWLVQTLNTYQVSDNGTLALTDSKELKREGNIDQDYQRWLAIGHLGRLPMSDTTRIDRLNDLANKLVKQMGRQQYDEESASYHVQMVLAEFYDSNPQALLQWIYKNRNKPNMIVEHFEQIFANNWRNKYTLVKAIEQMKDKNAQKYLEELTAQWGARDAVG